MRKAVKIVIGIIAVLVGLIALMLVWAYTSYPPDYVTRVLQMREESVYDYQVFPEILVEASDEPFYFEEAHDEATVQALFERDPGIDRFDQFLEDNATQAFIVIKDDQVLYEKYFNGAERDTIVTSFSIAKSFGSALIGAAIADGYIEGVDDPITDYLPELADRDPAFADITIDDLLHMSSGIRYVETGFIHGDDSKTYYFPDLRNLALTDTEIIDPPGSYFLYNNFHPLLLGMIIERATGASVGANLESEIWQRIGTEFDGSWSLDSEATRFEKMESGINGRAIDFAKFGRLYLNEGNWNGEQVIPAGWVEASTHPDQSPGHEGYYPESFIFDSHDGYYGHMWWGLRRGGDSYDFAALGNRGQFIYVSPDKNLI